MKKFKLSKRAIYLSVLFGTLCAVFASFANFSAACDDLRTNVLRLHIIANSDSLEDQELKLKIRDRLLEESRGLFTDVNGIDDAIVVAEENIPIIECIANRVIEENGFCYKAKAKVGNSYFETREYDDFTLPAGTYKSLVITLGSGEGKNWWCVIFPEICLSAADCGSLNDTANDKSAEIAYHPKRYKCKFWSVEKYEDIKKYLKNKKNTCFFD